MLEAPGANCTEHNIRNNCQRLALKYRVWLGWNYNQGHVTLVTQLLYLPFSLIKLFSDGLLVDWSNFEAKIEREREKDVQHNRAIYTRKNKTRLK